MHPNPRSERVLLGPGVTDRRAGAPPLVSKAYADNLLSERGRRFHWRLPVSLSSKHASLVRRCSPVPCGPRFLTSKFRIDRLSPFPSQFQGTFGLLSFSAVVAVFFLRTKRTLPSDEDLLTGAAGSVASLIAVALVRLPIPPDPGMLLFWTLIDWCRSLQAPTANRREPILCNSSR